MADRPAVEDAFAKLKAFLADGHAVLDGEGIKNLADALAVVDEWSKGLKRCLDGAHCPAKVSMLEIPSGLMVDKDTSAGGTIEFQSEHQAP